MTSPRPTLVRMTRHRNIWHRIVRRSRIGAWSHHAALTLWPFIFLRDATAGRTLYAHEYYHLKQQLVCMAIGAASEGLAVAFLGASPWWAVLVLLHGAFLLPYGVTVAVSGYHASWFERTARVWAAQHAAEFPDIDGATL